MIRDNASQNQVIAADPAHSTWVAANAGSGKTRVLTDRVARLLLEGVDPQNILCLTYTKAAAIEMQNRLFKRLGAWAMMDAKALEDDLKQLGFEGRLNKDAIADARTLFARAIETPGGLKIQTIHSFCSSILRRFPLEAGVSPQFREMEDQTSAQLRQDVLDQMSVGEQQGITSAFLGNFTGTDLDDILSAITGKKDSFHTDIDESELRAIFGIDAGLTIETCIADSIRSSDLDTARGVEEAFSNQSKTYTNFAADLLKLSYTDPTAVDFDEIKRLFLYAGKNTTKSVNFPQSNHKKAVEAAAPIVNDLHEWMDRVEANFKSMLAIQSLDRTKSLYDFAVPFVRAYEDRKLRTSQLDFDDLIGKTKALLSNREVAQWVLFRLDGGIDHVLVDEAQDTSPAQWSVIEALTREFSTGEGSRADVERTVFVVGDKQQSIYSFQGADPDAFDEMQQHFRTSLEAVEKPLVDVKLSHSFRSSNAILRVVDNTFTDERSAAIGKVQNHIAFNSDLPGRVDLWPIIEPVKNDDNLEWTDPVDMVSEAHHHAQMANRIAEQIKHMIEVETLPVKPKGSDTYHHRPVTAGDILILVQRRSDLFHEIISACKRLNLPIAGADRLRIGGELAVKDLTALLSFLALPEDDLSLACALRSPLLGWSEQDLYTLAHHRTSKYLWPALRDSDAVETLAMLKDLRDRADFLRPYDILERILTRHDGRKKLLARLGQEAEDGIDALLSQALAYESSEAPSLTGFLTWMQADDLEIKRQMDNQGDQIRVMTVHGSKGLEAPIVILPDCATRRNEVRSELLAHKGGILWKTRAEMTPDVIQDAKERILQKQSEERLRLLYVAMTRAENWLITAASGEVDDDTWYRIIEQGMEHSGAIDVTSNGMPVKRVFHGEWQSGEKVVTDRVEVAAHEALELLPVGTRKSPLILSPSDLGGAKALEGDVAEDGNQLAKARGTAIHLLLEKLPEIPSENRVAKAKKLLEGFPEHEQFEADLHVEITNLIEQPELAHIFAPGTLAEVQVTAELPQLNNTRMVGVIDRLLIGSDTVTAIDYKSNKLVPKSAEDTPDGLLRQMGAYAAALKEVFPDKTIETAILWTETGLVQKLPSSLVSSALTRVSIP